MTSDPADQPRPCSVCNMPCLAADGKHEVCPVAGLDDPGRRAYLVAKERQMPGLVELQYRLAAGGSFTEE